MPSQNYKIILEAQNKMSKTLKSVSGDVKTMQKNIKNTTKSAQNFTSSFIKADLAVKGILNSIRALGGVLSDASDFEQARIAFDTMLGSAERGKEALEELTTFAAQTPFQLQGVVQNAKRLLAYGVTAENLTETLKILGDVSLGNADIFNRVAFAFGQVKTAGKLFGTELRQFTEAGIPLIQALADHFGVAEGAIRKMVENSEVGFSDVEQALIDMTSEGGRFENLMEKQMGTVGGLFSNFQDILGITANKLLGINKAGEILEDGLFSMIKEGIKESIKFLDEWTGTFADGFNEILRVTFAFGSEFIGGLSNILTTASKGWTEFFNIIGTENTNFAQLMAMSWNEIITIVGGATNFIGKALRLVGFDDLADSFTVDVDSMLLDIRKFEKQTGESMEAISFDYSTMGDNASKSLSKVSAKQAKAVASMRKEWHGIQKIYRESVQMIKSTLDDLNSKHDKSTAKIKANLDDLKESLGELREKQFQDVGEVDTSIGEQVIRQREKILDIQKQINAEGEKRDFSPEAFQNLKNQKEKEENVLKAFVDNNKQFEEEIAEAKRRAGITEFERFIEDSLKKKEAINAEFTAEEENINKKILIQEEALAKEQLLFQAQRDEYTKTQNSFKIFTEIMIDGFDVMADNADRKAEFITRRLESMRDAMKGIKSFAPASSSPSDVGTIEPRANGGNVVAGRTYLVGEEGPELATFGASGHITPNNQIDQSRKTTNSFTIQILGNIIGIPDFVRTVKEELTREMKLQQIGSN